MKGYLYWSLLVLTGAAGGISYYSLTLSRKNLEKWMADVNKSIETWEPRIKDSVKKFRAKIKGYSNKENLNKLLPFLLSLKQVKEHENKGVDINSDERLKEVKSKYESDVKQLKEKIKEENSSASSNFEEIYQEIEKTASLIFDMRKLVDELIKERNEQLDGVDSNNALEKFNNLDREIADLQKQIFEISTQETEDKKKIKELEKQISEKQAQIELRLKDEKFEGLKNKAKIWIDLDTKSLKLLHLLDILYQTFGNRAKESKA